MQHFRTKTLESWKELLCNENSFDTAQIFTIDFSPLSAINIIAFILLVLFALCVEWVCFYSGSSPLNVRPKEHAFCYKNVFSRSEAFCQWVLRDKLRHYGAGLRKGEHEEFFREKRCRTEEDTKLHHTLAQGMQVMRRKDQVEFSISR